MTGKTGRMMPAKLVTGEDAQRRRRLRGQRGRQPGKDTGRARASVGGKRAKGTAKEKNGVLDDPGRPDRRARLHVENATASAGQVEIKSQNKSSIDHDIAIEGNGVNENGQVVKNGGDVEGHGRPQARHLHVLLLGPRPPRGRHGGQAHRQVAAAAPAPLALAPRRGRASCWPRAEEEAQRADHDHDVERIMMPAGESAGRPAR